MMGMVFLDRKAHTERVCATSRVSTPARRRRTDCPPGVFSAFVVAWEQFVVAALQTVRQEECEAPEQHDNAEETTSLVVWVSDWGHGVVGNRCLEQRCLLGPTRLGRNVWGDDAVVKSMATRRARAPWRGRGRAG